MPALTDPDRALCYTDFENEVGRAREQYGAMTKAELRLALNALDDFLATNATAINLAIPLPARTALSTPQKARLLMHIVRYRYIKGA